MIVIDASAMVEALIGRDVDAELVDLLAGDVAAPHLLDIEVYSVLRGLELGGKVIPEVADQARSDFRDLVIARYAAAPFADQIWARRHEVTSYDAWYLAVAQTLEATLCTCDARLAKAARGVSVRVFGRSR